MKLTFLFLAILCLSCSNPSQAYPVADTEKEMATVVVNHGDIVLFDLATMKRLRALESPEDLINGTEPPAEEWPSSFASRQGSSGCTATLIAEDVLQLAAHCVGNGRTAVIEADGKSYSGVCTHSPDYSRNNTADWALCKMGEPVPRPWYERILKENDKFSAGDTLTLAGAGCTQPGGGGGFGTFRVGTAEVTALPSGNNHDTVTKGGAALCYGDSGGSAFYVDGDQRWVMGVNSRGDIRTTSYLSSVFTTAARDFYVSWATENSALICGLHDDAKKCQGEDPGPGPGPGPLPQHCSDSMNIFSSCLFGNPRRALIDPDGCRRAYADLFACEEIAERDE